MLAALAIFKLSAPPDMGIATVCARDSNSAGRSDTPRASFPKTQIATFPCSLTAAASSSSPAPSVTKIFAPLISTISSGSTSSKIGICHNDPTVERTTFGLNTSTLPGTATRVILFTGLGKVAKEYSSERIRRAAGIAAQSLHGHKSAIFAIDNDARAMAEGAALGIAFCAKPALKEVADVIIDQRDLREILNYL